MLPALLRLVMTGTTGRGAFIDDEHFVTIESSVASTLESDGVLATDFINLGLASSGMIQHNNFLPAGVSFCTCQYTRWGTLSAFADRTSSTRTYEMPLAFWVSGNMSDYAAQIGTPALTQTATYAGHVIGTVHRSSLSLHIWLLTDDVPWYTNRDSPNTPGEAIWH